MIATPPLSRSEQLRLNARALLRDMVNGDFHKLPFHFRGVLRAVRAV